MLFAACIDGAKVMAGLLEEQIIGRHHHPPPSSIVTDCSSAGGKLKQCFSQLFSPCSYLNALRHPTFVRGSTLTLSLMKTLIRD